MHVAPITLWHFVGDGIRVNCLPRVVKEPCRRFKVPALPLKRNNFVLHGLLAREFFGQLQHLGIATIEADQTIVGIKENDAFWQVFDDFLLAPRRQER